jgi:hypothetical protein
MVMSGNETEDSLRHIEHIKLNTKLLGNELEAVRTSACSELSSVTVHNSFYLHYGLFS